jgi:hypothetical protein
MTFNQQSRAEMVQKEATLKNFFLSIQVLSMFLYMRMTLAACATVP